MERQIINIQTAIVLKKSQFRRLKERIDGGGGESGAVRADSWAYWGTGQAKAC
jgi:hypothetical protein